MLVWALASGAGSASAAGPAIAGVLPDWGPAGGAGSVRILGSGFTPGARVSFGAVSAREVAFDSSGELTVLAPAGAGTVDVVVAEPTGSSAGRSHAWFAYERAPGAPWLGLDGDSSNAPGGSRRGALDEFSRQGIVYDRSFDLPAGWTPRKRRVDGRSGASVVAELQSDFEDGMTPVVTVEFSGYRGDLQPTPYFPAPERTRAQERRGMSTVAQYVAGFLRTASEILAIVGERYPGMSVLLEPMNEPWGYTTPLDNGAQYARVLAALLPAARAAGIPLRDIYACAFGADRRYGAHGRLEEFAPGWIPAMYAAQPSLRSEVQGWYFHPYGPPSGTRLHDSWGIQSVPVVRGEMASGRDNIIVSEVGFCARSAGGGCDDSGEAEVQSEQQAAGRMREMLQNALPYSEAGWLRALIVYARSAGGWSMQEYASGRIEPPGKALEAFAGADGVGAEGEQCPLSAGLAGSELSVLVQGAGAGEAPALPGSCPAYSEPTT